MQTISAAHSKFVNTVEVVYTLAEYPSGLIITGSNDQTIAVHNIETNETIAHLREHTANGKQSITFSTSSNVLDFMFSLAF